MTVSNSAVESHPLNGSVSTNGHGSNVDRGLYTVLAHRGSLGRILALVVNERLVEIVFRPTEQLYYLSPLPGDRNEERSKAERFVISGSAPLRIRHVEANGDIIPVFMHESNVQIGRCCFQQKIAAKEAASSWIDVEWNVAADRFVDIIRGWTGWDVKLTTVFEERIRCSAQYLADTYAENRPCPTRESDYITWEQAIVEANSHPLHKCRMPVDPRTQPTNGFNFKRTHIAFMAVKRDILTQHGPLEIELEPLLAAAGIDSNVAVDSSEIVIPVHQFQIKFLLSLPKAEDQLRLLPHRIDALAQSSTRTMTVPSLPGIGIKLSLSLIIGETVRVIESQSAFNAVRYWTAGMLDPTKVVGLRGTPIEILPEVACANGLNDHLAVMVRWDPYHSSRPPVDHDVGYAVAGALCEPATIGQKGCVAESVFNLTSRSERLEFLREYTQLYFLCFLKPIFCNGLLIHPHGQNALIRYSRATGRLLGFSARDLSGTRFCRAHFEPTTGIAVDERMSNHDITVPDLLERAYFSIFVVHLWPLIIALDLHRQGSANFDSKDLLQGRASDIEASDLANGNGWAVIARELHENLKTYETLQGEDAVSISAREISAAARKIWMEQPTWPMRCYISQRMRADWAHRDRLDKASTIPIPNVILAKGK